MPNLVCQFIAEDAMKRGWVVGLFLTLLVSSAFAQGEANKAQNLRNCLGGFESRDYSQLTNPQAKEISRLQHDRNVWECLMGYGLCDRSVLTLEEAKQVADAEHRRNLLACETTIGLCDKSLLTPSEAERGCKNPERTKPSELRDGRWLLRSFASVSCGSSGGQGTRT